VVRLRIDAAPDGQAVLVIAILDIDGTLVDSNYQHALAWYRAFRDHDVTVPIWQIHRAIGMGGDQLVAHVAGDDVEERLGDDVREAEGRHYFTMIEEVAAFAGARDLAVRLKELGHTVVMASSAKPEEVDHYLDLLDAREIADDWTTSGDVEETKPAPDLVETALDKAGRDGGAVMIGDSVWDCEAAGRAGVRTYAVLTGGFSEDELRDAGAEAVHHSIGELLEALGDTPLGERAD
jgi:phosphoglycolate phosphatase-like HAD superfamily hydrolase